MAEIEELKTQLRKFQKDMADIEDKNKGPKSFYGLPDDDPHKFLRKLKCHWALQGDLSWQEKRNQFYSFLENIAEVWYMSLPEPTGAADDTSPLRDQEACERAFIAHFDPEEQKFLKQATFDERVLKKSESITSYINDLAIKGLQLGKSDEEVRLALIRGLPKPYKTFIFQTGPLTLEETQVKLKVAEMTIPLSGVEVMEATPSVDLSAMKMDPLNKETDSQKMLAVMHSMQGLLNQLTGQAQTYHYDPCYEPSRSRGQEVICWNCGGQGHYWRSCSSKLRGSFEQSFGQGFDQNVGESFDEEGLNQYAPSLDNDEDWGYDSQEKYF